jgi:hypothetical protein
MSQQSDEMKTGAGTTSDANQSASSGAEGKEVIDELTRLGQKFVEVIEVAWNSEQRKKIEHDLHAGLVTVAGSLEDGFKRVSSTKEAQEAFNAAEDVAAKVRSSKLAAELSDVLAQGLRALSDQMDRLSSEIKRSSSSAPHSTGKGTSPADESQDIPISRKDKE